jgi:hypothetical protein
MCSIDDVKLFAVVGERSLTSCEDSDGQRFRRQIQTGYFSIDPSIYGKFSYGCMSAQRQMVASRDSSKAWQATTTATGMNIIV